MLQSIREFATLNFLGIIQKITEKLPDDKQRDWVKWSLQVLQDTSYQAKIPELVRLIQNEADEVNSLYGKILFGRPKGHEPTVPQPGVKGSGFKHCSCHPTTRENRCKMSLLQRLALCVWM